MDRVRELPGDRRALVAVATQFFINGAVVASYVPRLPGIRDDLGLNLREIGLLLAAATLGGVVGSVVVARLIDVVGTKVTMVAGSLSLIALLPVISVVGKPWQLLVVLGALHAADVQTDVAMNLQGSALSERRSVPVMNRLHGMWSLGTVVGGVVAALMAWLDVSLGAHLVGAALVLLAAVGFVAPRLLIENDRPVEQPVLAGTRGPKLVALFALLGGAAIIPEMINSDWAAFRLSDDLDASDGLAGLAYVAFTVGMVVGRFSGDSFVARFGEGALLRPMTILTAAGVAVATLIPSVAAVFVGLFVAGLGVSVMYPQLYDNAARSPQPGAALGGLTAGGRLALVGAPAGVGALAQTEALSVGHAIALVTIPAALALALLTPRPESA